MIQWIIAYLAFAWVSLQVAELLAEIFYLPDWLLQALVWMLVFGFMALMVVAWYHGEKGEQRVSGPELLILAVIFVAAGLFLAIYDFEIKPEDAGALQVVTAQNRFANLSTRRLTGSRGYDGAPAWSPDSRSIVFVSQRAGNEDLWIRGLDGEARQLTHHPGEDTQPAWSPDGRHVLFVSSRSKGDRLDRSVFFGYSLGGGIWRVPAFGGEPSLVLEGAFNPTWSPDGLRFAFDASFGGPRRIWTADATGADRQTVSEDESDLAAHTRPSWSPDGRWIIFERQEGSQSRASELWLAPAGGGPGKAITAGQGRNFTPAWADENSIVFASDRGGAINLWQLDIDSDSGELAGEAVQLTLGAGEDIDPAVSGEGKLAYVSQQRLFNIWRLGVDTESWTLTTGPEPVFDTIWNDYAPALTADGKRLVFVSDREGEDDVWKLEPSAAAPVRLTDGPGQKLQPVWSPDERTLAYFSNQTGNNDIWVIASTGGAPVQITNSPADDINPYWSPDGSQLAFVSDRGGRSEVWVMAADGSDQHVLTDIGVTGHTARWSPDGEWIQFTSMASGDREIWAVSPDGEELKRLTELPTQDAHGLWSPDGTAFLYLSDHHVKWVQPMAGGEPVKLFEPGDRIDYTHLSGDGRTLLFTRERVEGDLWIME